jgi:hypothetical protein
MLIKSVSTIVIDQHEGVQSWSTDLLETAHLRIWKCHLYLRHFTLYSTLLPRTLL